MPGRLNAVILLSMQYRIKKSCQNDGLPDSTLIGNDLAGAVPHICSGKAAHGVSAALLGLGRPLILCCCCFTHRYAKAPHHNTDGFFRYSGAISLP